MDRATDTGMPSPAGSRHARTERFRDLASAALIAALLSASAWIALPIGAVPITFQTLFVMVAALVLRPLYAGAAVFTYLALGTAGLPVFSGGQGGMGVLGGPTGGYLVGFLLAALAGSLTRALVTRISGRHVLGDAASCAVVLLVIYGVGTPWLALVLGLSPSAALAAGVAPFILLDVAKAVVATLIARAVRSALDR